MSFMYRSIWVSSSLHVFRLNEDGLRIIMYYNNIVYGLKRNYRAMLRMAEGNNISYPYTIFVGTQAKEELGADLMV